MERGVVHHFFFSYARRDSADDPYLRRFYEDLRKEVSSRGGVEKESAGFFDIHQPTGTDWPTTSGTAVGSCKVFVPVYSPWYFNSDACGSEWHGFGRRLTQHHARTGEHLASVLPVWWLPPNTRPPATQNLHDTRDQFGATYREFGLHTLIRQKRCQDEYLTFLNGFALQILKAAEKPPCPIAGINLRTEPNAFAQSVQVEEKSQAGGSKVINFVVAAGTSAEMQNVRQVLDTYGRTWRDWAPYVPRYCDPLVLKAQDVAVEQRMISGPVLAGDDLIQVLDRAKKNQELVVLLVDPWIVGIERYRDLLEQLGSRRYMNVAILLPGDNAELRALPNGTDVGDVLRMCIGDWLDEPRSARQDLDTVEKFEDVLRSAIIDIRKRIVNHGEVARRVNVKGSGSSRPVLVGPEG